MDKGGHNDVQGGWTREDIMIYKGSGWIREGIMMCKCKGGFKRGHYDVQVKVNGQGRA